MRTTSKRIPSRDPRLTHVLSVPITSDHVQDLRGTLEAEYRRHGAQDPKDALVDIEGGHRTAPFDSSAARIILQAVMVGSLMRRRLSCRLPLAAHREKGGMKTVEIFVTEDHWRAFERFGAPVRSRPHLETASTCWFCGLRGGEDNPLEAAHRIPARAVLEFALNPEWLGEPHNFVWAHRRTCNDSAELDERQIIRRLMSMGVDRLPEFLPSRKHLLWDEERKAVRGPPSGSPSGQWTDKPGPGRLWLPGEKEAGQKLMMAAEVMVELSRGHDRNDGRQIIKILKRARRACKKKRFDEAIELCERIIKRKSP
jgi:hypothetical protein